MLTLFYTDFILALVLPRQSNLVAMVTAKSPASCFFSTVHLPHTLTHPNMPLAPVQGFRAIGYNSRLPSLSWSARAAMRFTHSPGHHAPDSGPSTPAHQETHRWVCDSVPRPAHKQDDGGMEGIQLERRDWKESEAWNQNREDATYFLIWLCWIVEELRLQDHCNDLIPWTEWYLFKFLLCSVEKSYFLIGGQSKPAGVHVNALERLQQDLDC